MHPIPQNLRMITPDHWITFANLAAANFTLLEHTVPTAPDVRMIEDIPDNHLGSAGDGGAQKLMSWTKGCYFGKSGPDNVMLCWQDMEALQSFCVGIESPERGFWQPIQSHYKIKYNDGKNSADWFRPSDNPADPYEFPESMNWHIAVETHAVKDQLKLNVTIEDKPTPPKPKEKAKW